MRAKYLSDFLLFSIDSASLMGKDELSKTYLLRATDGAYQLTVADAISITFDTDKAGVLDTITWGLFNSTM